MKNVIHQLDKAFDNKVRLGIMALLAVNNRLNFNELKELLDLTDGNLASHIKALESLTFIQVNKSFIGRKPNTSYEITKTGKNAFENHLIALELFINQQRQ